MLRIEHILKPDIMTRRKVKKTAAKINVKPKFADALRRLKRMKKANQKTAIFGASNEFIRDLSSFMQKIKHRPDLVSKSRRKTLAKHRAKLRKLIHAKTSIDNKRLILSQTGGILPFLIPIICASITAAGGIGAAATSAAIIKS